MILIADSGSSKTLWVIIKDGKEIFKKVTIGLNPNFIEKKWIENAIGEVFSESKLSKKINSVFFYGSGCASETNKKTIAALIKKFLPKANIKVETDILGAAIGVNGGKSGIACILGTGSNACLFNGKKITESIPSYGYIFGDHGSGADLGKNLLQKYFDNELSSGLKKKFEQWNDFSLENILSGVYKEKSPNRFLAGFSHFFSENSDDHELQRIKLGSFSDFFEKQVALIPGSKKYTLNFCGSISWFFHEEINEVAHHYGYKTGKIFQSPMQGLIEFHSQK